MKSIFIQQFLGSSFVSPALGGVGQGRLNINNNFPPKKIWAKPKQAGKKEGGLGEGIFARLLTAPKARQGWESVSAIPALAGTQNRKIFVSLIEKIFATGRLKNVKKIFLFCSPKRSGGGRKRWAGLPPAGRQLKVAVRIFVKKSSDFVQKVPPIFNFRVFEGYCLALASLGLGKSRDFEGIFEIQKQFLPAQTEVQFAKGKHKFEKFINQSFFFRLRRKAKR